MTFDTLIIDAHSGSTIKTNLDDVSCGVCGHIACICSIRVSHEKTCKFRIASTGAVAIECDHGFDVCPQCDPSTCSDEFKNQKGTTTMGKEKVNPNADIEEMDISQLKEAMAKCATFSDVFEKKVRENTKRRNAIGKRTTVLALGLDVDAPKLPGV